VRGLGHVTKISGIRSNLSSKLQFELETSNWVRSFVWGSRVGCRRESNEL